MSRQFFAAWLGSVLVMVWLGRGFIRSAAPTFDEPVHLVSGYSCLLRPGQCLNDENHPPFGELWAALPLLVHGPRAFFDHAFWRERRLYNYGDLFLYKNSLPAERLLDTARFWCLLTWPTFLSWGVLEWSLRLGGPAGLWAGALLLALSPPLISNAALVTTDMPAAVFFFLTCWLLSMARRSQGRWMLAGLCLGLGLASKFSLIIMPAVLLLGLGLESLLGRVEGRRGWKLLGLCASALMILLVVYRFQGLGAYWQGLRATFARLGEGRATFLSGDYSTSGFWLYFPAAFLWKTPLPLLIFSSAGLVASLKRRRGGELWLLLPPAVFFTAATISRTQIGYRHILPLYPFMIVLGARGAFWAWSRPYWPRALAGLAAFWLAASVFKAHPDHLAYFNELVPPGQGYRYLVDSNLDWGQGLKGLAREIARRGSPPIVLSYFGTADPSYYGLRYVPLGCVSPVERREGLAPSSPQPDLLAVSATNLQGLYFVDREGFSWLKSRTPVFAAGNSIFLYDLSRDPEGKARLKYLLQKNGYPSD
ncbi:MAG: glycosyltransferase family 39 protein [Elusimicrobia bacterium]|nr:glycosyltransferase family 39 protein [Elusimicrobiota bacterium]